MQLRRTLDNIKKSLMNSPVVFIQGPRRAGKTTLVRELLPPRFAVQYATLDDAATLSAARADPAGFLASLAKPAVIDEACKAPALYPAIREFVDRESIPGTFLLTGSWDPSRDPGIEALDGRMETFTLWPVAKAELDGPGDTMIDRLFDGRTDRVGPMGTDMIRAVTQGGYPEALARVSSRRRRAWFLSHAADVVERDLRDLANTRNAADVAALLRFVASRAGQLLSFADASRVLGLPQTTLKRHLALLRDVFLVWELPAWNARPDVRLVKSPRLMVTDTGLAAALQGRSEKALAADRSALAGLLENYVITELAKQAAWSETRPAMHHFRTYGGQGVGLILEDVLGRVVGVDVISRATPRDKDFDGLRLLARTRPDRFRRGVVLHLGDETRRFDDNLWALPLAGL